MLVSVVMALALAAAFSALAGGQTPKPGPVEKRIVLVPGNQPWTPTELMLLEKDAETTRQRRMADAPPAAPDASPGGSLVDGWGTVRPVSVL